MRFTAISSFALLSCVLIVTTGCREKGDYKEVSDSDLVPVEEHHHAHAAPHGGILVELGEHQYNAEIVFNDADPKLAVYILGAHAETPAAAKADSVVLTSEGNPISLAAKPQEGEAEGTASQFHLEGDLPEGLSAETIHGDISVEIDGAKFSGHVEPAGGHDHDHEHEGHDHDDHDHDDHDHEHETEPAGTSE